MTPVSHIYGSRCAAEFIRAPREPIGWEAASVRLGTFAPRVLLADLKKRPKGWLFQATRQVEKPVLADCSIPNSEFPHRNWVPARSLRKRISNFAAVPGLPPACSGVPDCRGSPRSWGYSGREQ
jgi:hypothetical protein